MRKPILFCDFDGTICHDRFWRSLDAGLYEEVQHLLFRGNKEMVNDWMRGKYSAEEINTTVANHIGISFEKLWTLFQKDCETMNVPANLLQKLNSLRGRFHVVLTTDNMDSFDRFTVPALGLQNYFDSICNSWRAGKFKNDDEGEIFTGYAERHGVPMQDNLLIDNSPSTCAVFSGQGGTAYLVNERENAEYHLARI